MIDKGILRRRALALIHENGQGVAGRLAAEFGLTRQTANVHLQAMLRENLITAQGSTRARAYRLMVQKEAKRSYSRQGLSEDLVWREFFAPVVADLPENVRDIWRYGITEMVNNAIDHSGSPDVLVSVKRNALYTEAWVIDQGEGIFHKIQRELGLYDPREAILELAKGKLTTDPDRHSGEGIFFTSKVFDEFDIHSRQLCFMHGRGNSDWLMERAVDTPGTIVFMRLDSYSTRTVKEVFDRFAAPEEYTFAKTLVPVRLAQYEGEKLVSRSQAKRLYLRFERFRHVLLDFDQVSEIGQAFADELFRVFPSAHPEVELIPLNMNAAVERMVERARAGMAR